MHYRDVTNTTAWTLRKEEVKILSFQSFLYVWATKDFVEADSSTTGLGLNSDYSNRDKMNQSQMIHSSTKPFHLKNVTFDKVMQD